MFSYKVKTGPIYGMETNIKSGNGWFLKFHGSTILFVMLKIYFIYKVAGKKSRRAI
jgi:hypothetical protein